MTTLVTIVYYSHFKGQTEALAQAVARGAGKVPGADVVLVRVEDVDAHWDRLHASDAIVFGTPTYIGSAAARFKEFMERLAGEAWLKRMWMNKIAGGFTCSAGRSGDKLATLMQLVVFAAQLGMIWVPVRITGGNYSTQGSEEDLNRMAGYLGVMAQANIDEPADRSPPKSDLQTAELHGHHLASVARQLKHGRAEFPSEYESRIDHKGRPATLIEMFTGAEN